MNDVWFFFSDFVRWKTIIVQPLNNHYVIFELVEVWVSPPKNTIFKFYNIKKKKKCFRALTIDCSVFLQVAFFDKHRKTIVNVLLCVTTIVTVKIRNYLTVYMTNADGNLFRRSSKIKKKKKNQWYVSFFCAKNTRVTYTYFIRR